MTAQAPHLRLVPAASAAPAGLPARKPPQRGRAAPKPIGQILIDMNAVEPGNMLRAIALRDRQEARLGEILLARGWVSEADLMAALALQWRARPVDLAKDPPDPRLIDRFGAEFCLAQGLVPWRQAGSALVVATARPEDFARLRPRLPENGPVIMALTNERDIHAALIAARQTSLIRRAEARVAPAESCRTLDGARIGRGLLLAAALSAALTLLAPRLAFALLLLVAVCALLLCTGLKALAFADALRNDFAARDPAPGPLPARLPVVSMLVPLFQEDDIAPRLIARLGRLDYPRELLDILLVVEEDDARTRAALAASPLPRWMRVITVPAGPIRTKPRALNYALDFCRGSIVGVWDAEDAPEPGQIDTVVRRFAAAPAEVACLQGVLDFYNARHSWLTRCFAIEYAAWFRVLLPGLARLGFVVPLGGTTLFFRREALERLGGWDAHNVTEDADLGLRLARHGYRTELIPTVTEEEPNGRVVSWVKQRSRWQKGFAMTWAVHMRDPVRLWRELGPKRFLGVQIVFLGSLSPAALAPVLWSFWLLAFGLLHPLAARLPGAAVAGLSGLFVLSELLAVACCIWAVRGRSHRHLIAWVPTLAFYFPLASLAACKALWEVMRRPFFWDKTRHGLLDTEETAAQATAPDRLPVLILTNPTFADPPLRQNVIRFPAIASMPSPRVPGRGLSDIRFPPARPAIEFQTSFEGF